MYNIYSFSIYILFHGGFAIVYVHAFTYSSDLSDSAVVANITDFYNVSDVDYFTDVDAISDLADIATFSDKLNWCQKQEILQIG